MDAEDDVEIGAAFLRRIVGDGFGDSAALDGEFERLLGKIGQAGEIGFAGAISADLQIGFALVEKTVAKLDGDLRVVDGLLAAVADGEICGASADAAVDFGRGRSGLRLRRRILRGLGGLRGWQLRRRVFGMRGQYRHKNTHENCDPGNLQRSADTRHYVASEKIT